MRRAYAIASVWTEPRADAETADGMPTRLPGPQRVAVRSGTRPLGTDRRCLRAREPIADCKRQRHRERCETKRGALWAALVDSRAYARGIALAPNTRLIRANGARYTRAGSP